ncbi:MAG TPA: response regulator transcription factor [Terriglobales bacterium]|nr:response regulator transcription factor [Terriglobales bacterium]
MDDFEPWRRFVSAMLQINEQMQIVGEAADGFIAVKRAKELQPDLILLDIDLPGLNGIEAARRIRESCPKSKILFASVECSKHMATEALRTGAHGYLVKSHAGRELLPALKAVVHNERFISDSLDFSAGTLV